MPLINALRSIGLVGGGLTIPMTIVGSVVLLLLLLRYASIRLIPSTLNQDNIKEIPMEKTLKARTRIFLSSSVESIWATGVGVVAGHLST